MSSDEFQILKISQRTRQINPKQNTSKIIQSKTSYQKVVTGGQTGTRYHRTIKPETTIASRRELNQSSLAYAGGKIQLPVRTTVTNQGRSQRTQETKAYKYENNANNNGINRYSRNQDKQVSSVGKAQVQRYNSAEQQKNFYKRYETSGSPVNRRTGPMTLGNKNANFNLKKWAYVSNKDMNKIIILQRWWRYLLKRVISKHGRHRRTYANQKAMLRSKSTKNPTSEFLKDFIKQGENITEKVYPGKNNKLIVETRKVEVFKNTKPKSKSKLKLKKTGENITEKIYKGKNNTLINEERKVEVYNVKEPQIPADIKMITTKSGEYALRVQHSRKIVDRDSKTEGMYNIKSTPDEKDTLVSERRKVEAIIIKEKRKKDDIKKSETEIIKDRKRLFGEKDFVQEKNVNIYTGRRIPQLQIPSGQDELTSKAQYQIQGQGQRTIGSTAQGKFDSKTQYQIQGQGQRTIGSIPQTKFDSKTQYQIQGQGQRTIGSIPQTKFDSKTQYQIQGQNQRIVGQAPQTKFDSKVQYQIQGQGQKIEGQVPSKVQYQIQGQGQRTIAQKKRFKEENGIDKYYIKNKMIEIWLDETSKKKESSFSLLSEEEPYKLTTFGTKNTLSTSRRMVSESQEKINKQENVNNLLKVIKDKNNELNIIVNELKSELKKTKNITPLNAQKIQSSTYKSTTATTSTSNIDSKIQQLLNIIKEKDEKLNMLSKKIKNQITQNNIYELKTKIYDESGQKSGRLTSRGRDKSYESYTNRTKTYNKNVNETVHRTIEENETLNTQNTLNNDNNETKVIQLETIIKEKETEVEKLLSEINTLKENQKEPKFSDLCLEQCYGLGVYSDKKPWIQTVKQCPINTLYICDKHDWNEFNEISQLDLSILNMSKNWDDEVVEEGNNALTVLGFEKDPLAEQKINLLQINGTSILDKWLDQIEPVNPDDKLFIKKEPKPQNILEQNNGLIIEALEKDTNAIQKINCIFVKGQKMPWENLEQVKEEIFITRKEKSENQIESRDSIEVISYEKEPLLIQPRDALTIYGFEKTENEYQRTQEMTILKKEKIENVIAQRDSIAIIGYDRDELVKQNINQLNIEGIQRDENIVQKNTRIRNS